MDSARKTGANGERGRPQKSRLTFLGNAPFAEQSLVPPNLCPSDGFKNSQDQKIVVIISLLRLLRSEPGPSFSGGDEGPGGTLGIAGVSEGL